MEKIITFSQTYKFEGKEYSQVDLSAIDELTAGQLCKCERQFEQTGSISPIKELNLEYCLIVASSVSDLPIEFFKSLKGKDSNKVKQVVGSYFFQED